MIFPLVGNERLRDTLLSAIGSDRLPHAVLLEGDEGLGRHTLMRFIAKALLCEGEGEKKGEDSCRSCQLFAAGTHPDFILAEPESGKKSISVDAVRDIRAKAFIKPHISGKRVFVFDKCDSLSVQSQNALLKILEEPPGNTCFILITQSKSSLLDTIISRCAVFGISPPKFEQALEYIKASSNSAEQEIASALKKTDNNIGRALALLGEREKDKIGECAAAFLERMLAGDELGQLKLLYPYEKDRVAADSLLSALKRQSARLARENLGSRIKGRRLSAFYSRLSNYEELLKTNINLSLLFSALVCEGNADKDI